MEGNPIAWVRRSDRHHGRHGTRVRGPLVYFAADGWHFERQIGKLTFITVQYTNNTFKTVGSPPNRMTAIFDESQLPAVYTRVK